MCIHIHIYYTCMYVYMHVNEFFKVCNATTCSIKQTKVSAFLKDC